MANEALLTEWVRGRHGSELTLEQRRALSQGRLEELSELLVVRAHKLRRLELMGAALWGLVATVSWLDGVAWVGALGTIMVALTLGRGFHAYQRARATLVAVAAECG